MEQHALATTRHTVLDIDEVCVVVGLLDVLARSSDDPIAQLARKYESLMIHRAEPGGDVPAADRRRPQQPPRVGDDLTVRLGALRRAYNTLVDENIRVRTQSEILHAESGALRGVLREARELVGSNGPLPAVPEGDARLEHLREALEHLAA